VRAYLAGNYASLHDMAIDPGGTDFQQLVWQALRQIPVGKTITYGELAIKVGNPTAARAVGMANSLNPIAIVIPCHRVIGARSQLTGYAGGLARKQWLLAHEGISL
jgi:methylated-DNA-[protein]-cysteine S-methyltransferase